MTTVIREQDLEALVVGVTLLGSGGGGDTGAFGRMLRRRLGDGELDAGEQVGEQRPERQADHDAGRARGSDQADTVLLHRLEGHQRCRDLLVGL